MSVQTVSLIASVPMESCLFFKLIKPIPRNFEIIRSPYLENNTTYHVAFLSQFNHDHSHLKYIRLL